MHFAGFDAAAVDHRQHIVAAAGGRGDIGDGAGGLVGQVGAEQFFTNLHRRIDMGQEQAPLDLAEVLAAGDDFLAGIAALGKADASRFAICGTK